MQSNAFPAQTQTDDNSDNKVCLYRTFQYQRYGALPGAVNILQHEAARTPLVTSEALTGLSRVWQVANDRLNENAGVVKAAYFKYVSLKVVKNLPK